jgi:putative membrane protein
MTAIALAPIGLAGGPAIAWGFMGVAFWILLILLLVLLFRGMRTAAPTPGGQAVHVLEERYARGEITREDFLERRSVLGGGSTGPGSSPTA